MILSTSFILVLLVVAFTSTSTNGSPAVGKKVGSLDISGHQIPSHVMTVVPEGDVDVEGSVTVNVTGSVDFTDRKSHAKSGISTHLDDTYEKSAEELQTLEHNGANKVSVNLEEGKSVKTELSTSNRVSCGKLTVYSRSYRRCLYVRSSVWYARYFRFSGYCTGQVVHSGSYICVGAYCGCTIYYLRA